MNNRPPDPKFRRLVDRLYDGPTLSKQEVAQLEEFLENDEALALPLIRHAGNDKREFRGFAQGMQTLLDFEVRHHFASDLAEAAQAIGDADEAILLERGNIAGAIPAVAQDFARFFRRVQVALHHIRTAHQQQTFTPGRQGFVRFAIDHADADSGKGPPNRAAFCAELS